ncbi:MAG: ABC transporter substrate-binding protein [Deltaproteobacteria bacterium]|nr:ABC transporter substrate-binding protein [Deltaproteobacteria bacterium]
MKINCIKKINLTGKMAVFIVVMSLFSAFQGIQKAGAAEAKVPEKKQVIMIGDRLVDVAYNLGVVPAAMSVRCSLWPMCEKLQTSMQMIGCPNCLLTKKAKPLLDFSEKSGISQVIIERSEPFCTYMPGLKLEELEKVINNKKIEIRYVDFTKGLKSAVKQTAELLGCPERFEAVMTAYEERLIKTGDMIKGRKYPEKIVVIKGTYQAETGKSFLQIESPGGYIDRFILSQLGCRNAGDQMIPANAKSSKGHVTIRKLDRLADAAPDAIIITGDISSGQKALADAIKDNPSLASVPAVKNMKVFGLPAYIDSSVMEYPMILKKWADALGE